MSEFRERRSGFNEFSEAIADLKGNLTDTFTRQLKDHAEFEATVMDEVRDTMGAIRDAQIEMKAGYSAWFDTLDKGMATMADDAKQTNRLLADHGAKIKSLTNQTATQFANDAEHLERIAKLEQQVKNGSSKPKGPANVGGKPTPFWQSTNGRVALLIIAAIVVGGFSAIGVQISLSDFLKP